MDIKLWSGYYADDVKTCYTREQVAAVIEEAMEQAYESGYLDGSIEHLTQANQDRDRLMGTVLSALFES